jgi:hypothetical protein
MGTDIDEISVRSLRPQDRSSWLLLWRGSQTFCGIDIAPQRGVRAGSRVTVAGRRMAQPVYPQLRKCPTRSGTYVSCTTANILLSSPFVL